MPAIERNCDFVRVRMELLLLPLLLLRQSCFFLPIGCQSNCVTLNHEIFVRGDYYIVIIVIT